MEKLTPEEYERRKRWDFTLPYGQDRESALMDALCGGRFQVKSDRMAQDTGNVFIEYECNGKKSGIKDTKADFYALEYALNCWVIMPVETLKRVAREVYKERGSVRGGDGKRAVGVLVPLARLMKPPDSKTKSS